jgi:hypothetical protein
MSSGKGSEVPFLVLSSGGRYPRSNLTRTALAVKVRHVLHDISSAARAPLKARCDAEGWKLVGSSYQAKQSMHRKHPEPAADNRMADGTPYLHWMTFVFH